MGEGSAEEIPLQTEAADAMTRLMAIAEQISEFRRTIKPELTCAINDYLRTQSPESASEKKELAAQVSGFLSALGFAIEHDGVACSFYAFSGQKDPRGRFRIQPHASKTAIVHSGTLEKLLPLVLTDLGAVPKAFRSDPQENPTAAFSWRDLARRDDPGRSTP